MPSKPKLIEAQFEKKVFSLPFNFFDQDLPKFLPTQSAFVHDWEHRFQAIGGGLGNGKTTAIIGKAFYLSTLFPRNRGYIGRWDGKELLQTTMSEFFNAVPASMFETHNKAMGYIKFKRQYGGSEIYYGDLKEARGLKNINLGWFIVDQAEELDEERWNLLVSRLRKQTVLYGPHNQPLRRPDGSVLIAPTYGIAAFNPEGTASFLYRFFHPESPEKQPNYQLYQATTFDGLAAGFTTQEYVDDMLKVFSPQARRRYLEGSWEVFEGRVFPQFTRESHVIPPMTPSPHWTYYVSIDHGLSNPTSIGIWGVTPDGIKIRLRSHYEGGGKPVSYHASRLKALISDLPAKPKEVMDPACWARNQSRGDYVFAIVDEYNAHGVFPFAGQNDWQAGFNRINEHLSVDPRLVHPYTGQLGSPRILFCSGGENEHCISEFMNYKWKKAKGTILRNAPDEPVDHNDHAIDETRYLLSVLPTVIVPEVIFTKKDPLQLIRDAQAKWNPLASGPRVSAGSWMSC